MRTRTRVFAASTLLALVAQSASAQFYTNAIGEGLSEGISDNGVATGSFGTSDNAYFVWTVDGGTVSIGGVAPGNGVGGQGKISNDGRFISGSTFNAAEGYHEMSRYDRNTGLWTGFGMIPVIGQQLDASVSSGWGISGDGTSVVGLGWTTEGTADAHAMQWMDGVGVIDLGTNMVGESARANAADLDGNVVVGWQDGAGRQGSVWVDGVQELIFLPDASPALEAFAVSSDGQWVTGIGVGGFFDPGMAYRYNTVTNTTELLPNLVVGGERNMAGTGITADGATIAGGTWGFGPALFGRAYIWREGVGTIDFSDYLDEVGVAYDPTFVFAFVSDVSPNGEWFTGWGNFGAPGSVSFFVHIKQNCNEADLAEPFGSLDFSDVVAFLTAFGAMDPAADLAPPMGVFDFSDVVAFLGAFGAGCP